MSDIPQLLRDARELILGSGLANALIGGCAVNAYTEPRATKDVDFVVEVAEDRYPRLVEALDQRGFWPASVVGDRGSVPDLALYRDPAGRRVDILFAHTLFEQSALQRRETREPYAGVALEVVSPEDLIVYKVVADRQQDRADIESVIAALAMAGRELDWEYIERWCDVWEVGDRLRRIRGA